jgi:hypothetical protein
MQKVCDKTETSIVMNMAKYIVGPENWRGGEKQSLAVEDQKSYPIISRVSTSLSMNAKHWRLQTEDLVPERL